MSDIFTAPSQYILAPFSSHEKADIGIEARAEKCERNLPFVQRQYQRYSN